MNRVFFKEGVIFNGVSSRLLAGLAAVAPIVELAAKQFVVTSALDGVHMQGSLHYDGRAADLRSHTIPRELLEQVLKDCKSVLGSDWDVVLESKNLPNEHIHIEYDPKGSDAQLKLAGV